MNKLLILCAVCFSMLGLPSVSRAQTCAGYQWYGAESFVWFQLDIKTALVVYGLSGHAYSEATAGSGSMAHMGRSFAPTRWEIVRTGTGADSLPGHRWALRMKQIRAHDPCDVPEFYIPTTPAAPVSVNVADFASGNYFWRTGGTFNVTSIMATLNSNPGEYQLEVGMAGSGGEPVTTVLQAKGYFYAVADSLYATRPKMPPPDGDQWGSVPSNFDTGPVNPGDNPSGGGTGITPDDLNDQNVNQDGFWQSLFQPSEEMWDEFVNKTMELQNWGPFGMMTIFSGYVEEYEAEGDGYVLELPYNAGVPPLVLDMTQYSGFIIFFRHLAAGVLWFIVVMQVKNRFIQKV